MTKREVVLLARALQTHFHGYKDISASWQACVTFLSWENFELRGNLTDLEIVDILGVPPAPTDVPVPASWLCLL